MPEKFLGPDFQTASAVTNAAGVVSLIAPGPKDERPGVPPGFYRVEITKPGLAIPAKYNTETILGIEVSDDLAAHRVSTWCFEDPWTFIRSPSPTHRGRFAAGIGQTLADRRARASLRSRSERRLSGPVNCCVPAFAPWRCASQPSRPL